MEVNRRTWLGALCSLPLALLGCKRKRGPMVEHQLNWWGHAVVPDLQWDVRVRNFEMRNCRAVDHSDLFVHWPVVHAHNCTLDGESRC